MAKNTLADLDVTSSNNTDVKGQSTAGSALASTIDTIVQNLMGLLAQFYTDIGGQGGVGGTANAITVTSSSTYQALESGLVVTFKATATNTGATTLNLDSLGAKAVRRQGDVALTGGEIVSGGAYLVRYDAALNGAAGAWVLLNSQPTIGEHEIFVPASAMVPATTTGAANGSVETTTNKVMLATKDFDASQEEFAQFSVRMPTSWNLLTLTARFLWSHAATTTNFGVAWGIEAVAISNDDAQDASWGTEVAVTDTGGTTNDLYISDETSAVTVGGSPAAGDLVYFRVTRVVGNGSDNLAVDARLHGVTIYYTTKAATDD